MRSKLEMAFIVMLPIVVVAKLISMTYNKMKQIRTS